MYRSKKCKTSLQYRLKTSRTLQSPAKGTGSLEQTIANTISKPSGNKHTERNKLAGNDLLGGPKTSSDWETRFLARQQMIQLERRPTDSRLQQANHESISLEVQKPVESER
jgi:hypothetical protein